MAQDAASCSLGRPRERLALLRRPARLAHALRRIFLLSVDSSACFSEAHSELVVLLARHHSCRRQCEHAHFADRLLRGRRLIDAFDGLCSTAFVAQLLVAAARPAAFSAPLNCTDGLYAAS